jgi:hypothetical protein
MTVSEECSFVKIRTCVPALFTALLSSSVLPSAMAQDQADAPTAPAIPEPDPAGSSEAAATVTVGGAPIKDQPSSASSEATKERKLPFRGSTFFLDQSLSTQTAHLETSARQSYVPLYEWWFSFRPRWYFTDKLYVWARFDLTKEWTNSQETTLYREDVFGDVWTDLRYETPLAVLNRELKLTSALRAMWPTSKESQGSGIYVTAAASETAAHTIRLNGERAKFFNDADVALSLIYSHPFSRATTPTNPNLNYTRAFTEDRQFVSFVSGSSDQVAGQTLVNHQVMAALHGGLQITPKVGATLDMIFINQWHYAPKADQVVPVSGGGVFVPRSADDTQFTQKTWFIASLQYSVFDEVELGLGYYNLASEIAPNGQRRGAIGGDNVWWSPDARVFFDITLKLDKLYELGTAKNSEKEGAAKAGVQQRTLQRVQRF